MAPTVFIALATHNGERFLAEQIESLQGQTFTDWMLLIRDDDSTDRTLQIAGDFSAGDSRIDLMDSGEHSPRRAADNFRLLFKEALDRGARYVFSCDQDDIWDPEKVSRMTSRMRELEGDGSKPVLLHHDLEVVDQQLQLITDSYWSLMKIAPGDEQRAQRLVSRNEVTGCAMACNRALLEIALPIPPEAIMHDWWLALCAASFGKLRSMPERLVQYRQHAANVIGARSFWSSLFSPQDWLATWRKGNLELVESINQARVFQERFRHNLKPDAESALAAYCRILQGGPLNRLRSLGRAGAWRRHWLLDATLVARVLTLKSPD